MYNILRHIRCVQHFSTTITTSHSLSSMARSRTHRRRDDEQSYRRSRSPQQDSYLPSTVRRRDELSVSGGAGVQAGGGAGARERRAQGVGARGETRGGEGREGGGGGGGREGRAREGRAREGGVRGRGGGTSSSRYAPYPSPSANSRQSGADSYRPSRSARPFRGDDNYTPRNRGFEGLNTRCSNRDNIGRYQPPPTFPPRNQPAPSRERRLPHPPPASSRNPDRPYHYHASHQPSDTNNSLLNGQDIDDGDVRPLVVDVPSLLPPPPPPPPPSPPSRKAKAKAKDKGRDKSKDKDKDKDKDKGKIKSKVKVKHRSDQSTSGPVAPVPLETYLTKSLEPSTRLSQPAQLLVILDLNGTLLCRTKGKSAAGSLAPTLRPGLREFLAYLLSNFKAMIWTSARPENAARMVNAAFKEDEKEKLLAIWGRDTLGLTQAQYNAKVQVYKVLGRAWEGEFMVYHPDQPDSIVFDQTNTVLFDDSIEKAVGHPYNLIHIPEFLATKAQNESDVVLCQCIDYLEEVKWQSNVSAFIRQYPFVYTPTETIGEIDNKETEMGTSSHDEKEMDNDDIRN